MALELITGPAHAGKIAELYARYLDELAHGRAAALVVPSSEAKRSVQQDLLARAPAVIGADPLDFDELFERILRHTGDQRRLLRGGARRILLRRVLPDAPDGLAARLQRLGSALLGPDDVREADPALAEMYATWWRALDDAKAVDRGRMRIDVVRALETDVAAWPQGEALFAQGFDDLSPAQEAALRLIAERSRVVLSLAYEAGRPPFAVLTDAVGRLAERAEIVDLPAAPGDRHADLVALERRFGEPDPDARCAASATGGVVLAEAEGERGEAEIVLREVASALRAGVPGDRIAILAPRGAADRRRLVRQLREADVAVDADEQRLLARTPFGRALMALLRSAWADEPGDEDRLTWLRSPWSGAPRHLVDQIERGMRRSRETFQEGVDRVGEPIMRALAPPAGTRGAATPVDEVRAAVRGMLRRAHGDGAPAAGRSLRDDVAQAGAVLRSLERLEGLEATRDDLLDLLSREPAPGARPRRGAIRVLDLRAARTADLDIAIVVGLEDVSFGAASAPDPLVEASDPGDVARHLAYTAITRPRQRLVLVRRIADDEGRPVAPTAIWEDLVAAAGDPGVALRRRFSEPVHPVDEAPTVRERARAIAYLAATDRAEAERLAGAAGVTGALRRATAWLRRDTRLTDPSILGVQIGREVFNVTDLDRFGACSSVWLVEKLLQPNRIDVPVDDRFRVGTMAHAILARFYREAPGLLNVTAIGPAQADAARTVAEGMVEDAFLGVRPIVAGDRLRLDLMRATMLRDVGRLVRAQARSDAPLVPTEFEIGFGSGNAAQGRRDGVDVGVARLSGKIDRIDTDPSMTARAIIVDYKTSRIPNGKDIRERGELQVPLYLLALREVLGREPVGGLFISIRKGEVRGLVDAAEDDVLPPILTRTDLVDHEEFERVLEAARAAAADRIGRIRAGDIRHDPSDRRMCEKFCDHAGICRVARR